MDSLTQLALGAAVCVTVMGRRTKVWKAALWGGIAGTLPDLDVLIDQGDDLRNMIMHRGASHALFWLMLSSPLLAALPAWLHREPAQFRYWWLAIWLALVTHPLLDTMTIYGTHLLLPFVREPLGVGSIFIVDPLYTVPLLVGLGMALRRRDGSGLRWNRGALLLSTLYLAWSVAAQWHVREVALAVLPQGIPPVRLQVTPTPLNTVLWRVLVMHEDGSYEEGFYSLLDGNRSMRFTHYEGTPLLREQLGELDAVRRLARFSHGFYRVHEREKQAWVTDLRMGQEPNYIFSFLVARRQGEGWLPVVPRQEGSARDLRRYFAWLWQRMIGRDVAPPV